MEVSVGKTIEPFTPFVVTIKVESAAEHAALCAKLSLSTSDVMDAYAKHLAGDMGVASDDVREAERACGYELYVGVRNAYKA